MSILILKIYSRGFIHAMDVGDSEFDDEESFLLFDDGCMHMMISGRSSWLLMLQYYLI